jgi:hypothetical protein
MKLRDKNKNKICMTSYNHAFVFSIGTAIIIFTIVLINFMTTPNGIGISNDSVNYLSSSSSLITGEGFKRYDGEPFSHWPPLFPILLGIIRFSGSNPINVLPYVHGFFLGLTGAFCFFFIFCFSRSWILSICYGLAVVTSTPLVNAASILWSETIYTFFMFYAVISALFYLRQPNFKRLAVLGVVSGLAFLQRYSGFFLVVAVCCSIFLFENRQVKKRLRSVFVFGIISCLPGSIWIAGNILVTNTLTGSRYFSPEYLSYALVSSFNALGSLFVPDRFGLSTFVGSWFVPDRFGLSTFVGFLIIFTAALIVVYGIYKKQERFIMDIAVLSVFIVIYFFSIVYTLLTACCVSRFMTPLYPIVIVFIGCVFVFFIQCFGTKNTYLRWSFMVIATMFIVGFLSINGWRMPTYAKTFRERGVGYNTQKWRQNSVIEYLRQRPFGEDVCMISNAAAALKYYLDVQCVMDGPRKGAYYHNNVRLDERAEVASKIINLNKKVIFVWFEGADTKRYFNVEALNDEFRIENLIQTNDGVIYEIKSVSFPQ